MKRTNIFLHSEHMKSMNRLAQAMGLKTAQLVRVAIAEFLRREARKA